MIRILLTFAVLLILTTSSVSAGMVQGYLAVDIVEMDIQQEKIFTHVKKAMGLHLGKNKKKKLSREMYMIQIKNPENIPIILEELSDRNPVILGLWNLDGTPCGIIQAIYEAGKIISVGEPAHPYKKKDAEEFLSDRTITDESGNVVEILGKLHHSFAGFELPEIMSE